MKTHWRDGGRRDPARMEFDVVSYGRRGPTAPRVFNSTQLAQLSRTAGGAPEVMVKVTGGGRDGQGVAAHFDYVGRKGQLEIETDDGQLLAEQHLGKRLVEDWDLDIYAKRIDRRWLTKNQVRRIPKLVHNITLSMPAKTDAQKVLAAARAFATEQFALKHRYALALHTDTPHPHVHLTVKAESEEGQRLYIRKATLRQWRADFARHLREQGIEANATPRAVRWQRPSHKPDGQFRAEQRGASTVLRQRVKGIVKDVLSGTEVSEAGKAKLEQTRQQITTDWKRSLGIVLAQGQQGLALQIARFIRSVPAVRTDREELTIQITAQAATKVRT